LTSLFQLAEPLGKIIERLTGAEEIVGIVHGKSILVMNVSVDSVVGDTTSSSVISDRVCCSVVDGIFGIKQVSSRQPEFLSTRLSLGHLDGSKIRRLDLCSLLGRSAWSSCRLEITRKTWDWARR